MPAHTPIRVLGPQFAPSWHRPWFRYIDPVPGAEGASTPPAPGAPVPAAPPAPEDLGFPKDTPLEQMTPEQVAAYWKNQSKVQQRIAEDEKKKTRAYEAFGSVEDLQNAANAAEQSRQAALSEADRTLEQAKAAARAEGIAEGGARHLAPAITGWLVAHVKGAEESLEDATARVAGAIEFADLTKFVGENGDLDAAKVQTFAKSIGSADSGAAPESYPLFEAMQRQSTPAPGGTGSVAAIEAAAYKQMTTP
ncbi:hypothetical protein [Microbacterium sp. H6]|uniref:hypothetical protein n=1 Tax=Microbacterium sp. H6 TaxID=421122 RepID=UPI000DE2F370|nr:hypothetical protein [Microbacterium sp. H6]RBO73528.1 hypothetical protein DSP71_05065 [Microbacterium sp. H6]